MFTTLPRAIASISSIAAAGGLPGQTGASGSSGWDRTTSRVTSRTPRVRPSRERCGPRSRGPHPPARP